MAFLGADFQLYPMMEADSLLMRYGHRRCHVAVADNRNPGRYLFQFCLQISQSLHLSPVRYHILKNSTVFISLERIIIPSVSFLGLSNPPSALSTQCSLR